MYCKHCGQKVEGSTHYCPKEGLLEVDENSNFLVSSLIGLGIGAATDSSILGGIAGGLIGGSFGGGLAGGILGDILDGDLLD